MKEKEFNEKSTTLSMAMAACVTTLCGKLHPVDIATIIMEAAFRVASGIFSYTFEEDKEAEEPSQEAINKGNEFTIDMWKKFAHAKSVVRDENNSTKQND